MKAIDWNLKVANPEAFGEAEKERWTQVEPVLMEVLDELWKSDKIETVYELADKRALDACIQKVNNFSRVYNTLLHLSDSREKAARFTEATSSFGLDEHVSVANFLFVTFSLTVLKIELFKLVLMFHLKDVGSRIAVSEFNPIMRNAVPHSWPRLQKLVDSPLRNALAHGTYSMLGDKIVLYKDSKLKHGKEMDLGTFIMNTKAQDVLLQCLIDALKQKGIYALRP